ncbi:MAG TPA: hypothetical protein VF897_19850 [Roseiflexaceae bacterium]
MPGWVYGPDLRAVNSATTATTMPAPGQAATSSASTATAASPTPSLPQVTALESAPLPPQPSPAPRVPLTVAVRVVAAQMPPINSTSTAARAGATPIPGPQRRLGGVRVQLVDVFGDVLTEAMTAANGEVTLTRDVAPETAVLVRVPALGLQYPIDRAQPALTIAIPDGGTP